ncbi:Protein of unknown function [Pyronema omphalodes CBS 100304]|uniref:Uncharacterized protein n=1 Tax=Pyronema omphalodes (strain CBS 100304) TaxID=1076935 RepID=U4KZ42_PYROM|nr:Protein of unknown function [Pyronema omphalodes CBS 100304]
MLFHKEQTDMEIPFVDFTRRFRIIETDKTTYDSWICREGSCIEIEPLVKESITVAKLPDSNESLPIYLRTVYFVGVHFEDCGRYFH